jgi:hypothetical protein
MTADMIPMSRKVVSGVSKTCAIARLTNAGNAANKIPSMAKTKPIATRKSDIKRGPAAQPRGRDDYRAAGASGVGGGAGARAALEGRCAAPSRGLPAGSTK